MKIKDLSKKSLIVKELVRAKRNKYVPEWKSVKNLNLLKDIKSNTKILIATGGGGYSAAKQIESLLSVALKLRNVEVEVLLCDGILPGCFQTTIDWDSNEKKFAKNGTSNIHCKTCFKGAHKTYKMLGVAERKISELLHEHEKEKLRKLSEIISIEDIPSYKDDGVSVGEHAMAGALRYYAKANLDDKYSDQILRRYFFAALLTHQACKNLFNLENYSSLVLHHGIYVPQGIISETSMKFKIPTITWHVAYRKQCLIFSHNGTYHKTLMDEPVENWLNMRFSESKRLRIADYLSTRWSGKNDQISFSRDLASDTDLEMNLIDKDLPTALMLTNVLWDAQLHYPNNAFKSMTEWILYTVKYFSKRSYIQLIIRVHPAEVSGTLPSRQTVKDEIKKRYGELPKNIIFIGPESNLNTYKLANLSDCALIYGTKTGVELTSMGIPTIVAGEAWVRGKGSTIDVNNPEEYENALNKIPFNKRLSEEKKINALKYAYHFFFRRMIFLKSIKYSNSHNTFNYTFNNIEDLLPGNDKGLDVICDGIIHKKEFIYDEHD